MNLPDGALVMRVPAQAGRDSSVAVDRVGMVYEYVPAQRAWIRLATMHEGPRRYVQQRVHHDRRFPRDLLLV